MTNTLQEICTVKKEHVARAKRARSETDLLAEMPDKSSVRPFHGALQSSLRRNDYGLIAEIKKASPSRGVIRPDFHPARLAEAYAKGGATCLSVLTDAPYFQGQDAYLMQAREACELPALRKDFMLEPYQIIESRLLGADCILLIMAALSDAQAEELFAATTELGMDALIETHNAEEIERALALKPTLLGINNRNLKTLDVSLDVCKTLAPMLPDGVMGIAESGIRNHADITALKAMGLPCFLVGESLMQQEDVMAATRALLGI